MGSIGAFIGGTIGWYAGEGIGMMTAFMLSIVGTGVGIYFAKKMMDRMMD
jgi:hypothetical protein